MLARYHEIDPDELDHEVHRFGHFAVGWIEEVAYRPGSAVAAAADKMRQALDSYAILDEMDHSELEFEEVLESWDSWQAREVRRDIVRELVSRIDPEDPTDMSADDEIEEWLDTVDDETLGDLVHDRGEIYDGALHLSKHDIANAATALVEQADGASE
jgi:hypothetical protein